MQLWYGMDPVKAVGAAMLLALTAYAIFGGADFGGGIWDLLAAGPRARQQREAIARAMGPVWEANHVWLIFLLVLLFTAFPTAFGMLSVAFFGLFHVALAGIVLRGSAFVFRANTDADSTDWRAWASIFGAASVVTPFLLGSALGAISDPNHAWFSPVSLGIGALTLALMAYLAATFLTVETEGSVQEDFRVRALGSGIAVAVLAVCLLPLIARLSPLLWQHLSRPQSAPPMLAGALLAAGSAWAVWTRRFKLARAAAVAEVVIVLWGWAFAQWPYLIYPDMTVYQSAASLPTIRFVLTALPFGFALLIPSLLFLFTVFKGHR